MNFSKCPSNLEHGKDDGMVTHGTREAPLPVPDTREEHYVESEYHAMAQALSFHHLCTHALLKYDGKVVDRNIAREANGTHHVFYFDVTVPWNAAIALKNAYIDNLRKNRKRLKPRELQLLEAIEEDEKGRAVV